MYAQNLGHTKMEKGDHTKYLSVATSTINNYTEREKRKIRIDRGRERERNRERQNETLLHFLAKTFSFFYQNLVIFT